MSKDEALWVLGCPYCMAFSHLEIQTKLYWPEDISQVKNSEFIIIECPKRKIPLIIYRDHIPTVLSESWGRMLYRARNIFGDDIKINISSEYISDHFNCYVIKSEF